MLLDSLIGEGGAGRAGVWAESRIEGLRSTARDHEFSSDCHSLTRFSRSFFRICACLSCCSSSNVLSSQADMSLPWLLTKERLVGGALWSLSLDIGGLGGLAVWMMWSCLSTDVVGIVRFGREGWRIVSFYIVRWMI